MTTPRETTTSAPQGATDESDDLIQSVSFVNDEDGYAVGLDQQQTSPVLAVTSNGGSGWTMVSRIPVLPDSSGGYQIAFVTREVGIIWVPGIDFFEETNDAGLRWTKVTLNDDAYNLAVSGSILMFSEISPSCSTVNPTPLHCPIWIDWSNDGALKWNRSEVAASLSEPFEPDQSGPTVSASAVASAQDAFFLIGGHLYATFNSGASWNLEPDPCDAEVGDSNELAATTGPRPTLWLMCGGEPGVGEQSKEVFVSQDGGDVWFLRSAADIGPSGQKSIGELTVGGYTGQFAALSTNLAYMALGRFGVIQSKDGGRTWTQDFEAGAYGPGEIDIIDPTHGWASYQGGAVWATNGSDNWKQSNGTFN